MIRCIASDMDGTLLNSRQEISEFNRDAILKAQGCGVEFVVATGRSYQEAKALLEKAGIKCPVIGVNGAEIRSTDGDIEETNSMPRELSLKAAKVLNGLGVYFELYTNKGTYSENYNKNIEILVDVIKTANPERSKEDIRAKARERVSLGLVKTVENYTEVIEETSHSIYKMIAFSKDEELLNKAVSALEELDGTKITSSGHGNIEINYIEAQKGIALEAFTAKRGISLEDTMAIGDNFNDLSMFKKAGHPVAMENAEPEVKKFCKEITARNDENGVGKAILRVLEKE